jgi:hypothetical protein
MVLGGFVAGFAGLLGRWDRAKLEFQVLRFGYGGASLCLVPRLVDMATI